MTFKPAKRQGTHKNERGHALELLCALLDEQRDLSYLFSSRALPSPFTKEICFGVCRQYYRLEAIVDCFLTKRPKTTDIWVCLLMGIYQLHYLNLPDYAVVKETVDLIDHLKKTWAKGLVNAILRTYCREKATLDERLNNNEQFKFGHPSWFIKRVQKAWPNDWQSLLTANDAHPPMSLRVNARHLSRDAYLAQLKDRNMPAHPLLHTKEGLILETPCDVFLLPGFKEGDVSVQDGAAQLAATLLDLKPGLRVLDACAAPGGKTCHLLETQPDLAECVALDIDKKRVERTRENLQRLKLNATLIEGDGLHPETWWDGIAFDRILLDAPCSATGVIRRHPDIKLLRKEEDILTITEVQRNLLKRLWPLLAPGGRMVYATCSVLPEENEKQMIQFVSQTTDCVVLENEKPWGHQTEHGLQILPEQLGMDGFFYCVLQKK